MRSILIEAEPGLQFGGLKIRSVAERVIARRLPDREVELSIFLVRPTTMRRLNRLYRGKDAPTTVLEFSQVEKKAAGDHFVSSPAERLYLGDLVLCLSEAAKLAGREGVDLQQEVKRLLVHGLNNLFTAAEVG